MSKPTLMGATFAERKAAAEGKSTFVDPTPAAGEADENTTFADRAKAGKKASAKQVDSDAAENKAVAKKATSRKKA